MALVGCRKVLGRQGDRPPYRVHMTTLGEQPLLELEEGHHHGGDAGALGDPAHACAAGIPTRKRLTRLRAMA